MSEDNDFFKNAKHIKEEDDILNEFKKYYNVEEENDYQEEENDYQKEENDYQEEENDYQEEENDYQKEENDYQKEENDFRNNMFGGFDYNQFMNQSSSEYMIYSTMDLLKTMNIMSELKQLFASLSDWDRLVIYYAYELMQRNMQLAYKLVLYLFKTRNEELVSQMIYWGLLLFCLSNVQTAYSYLIYRVYKLDKAFARKLHEFMKEQFMFFENSSDMYGSFTNMIPNRLDQPQGGRYSNTENIS